MGSDQIRFTERSPWQTLPEVEIPKDQQMNAGGSPGKEMGPLPPGETSLTPALEKISKTAVIFDYRFHFKIHEATRRVMVQVIDQETGEVLNEIPPEKILDLVAHIQELMGLLVDERV